MENKGKKVSLQLFEETARNNGYEVFTPDEVASYCKEGIMKSRANELTAEEKEAFVADVMYLQKAVCADEEGKDVIRFYRPKQVEWETAADGTVMKGLEGVYRDTPECGRTKAMKSKQRLQIGTSTLYGSMQRMFSWKSCMVYLTQNGSGKSLAKNLFVHLNGKQRKSDRWTISYRVRFIRMSSKAAAAMQQ